MKKKVFRLLLTIVCLLGCTSASAFEYCSGITEIIIPNSATSKGKGAFYFCPLTSVTSFNPIPPKIWDSTFSSDTYTDTTLHVPEGCITIYRLHPYWENFLNVVDDASEVNTGIQVIGASKLENDAIYTIGGMKLNTTNTDNLPKGIYIINGKKVIVK